MFEKTFQVSSVFLSILFSPVFANAAIVDTT